MAYTTIKKSSDYFNTVLYTGNGSARTITTGMQPDLNWIKRRNQVDNHWWTDSVRGATKYIGSNRTNAEATETTAVTGITSTGFTLGDDSNQGEVNANTYTYCSWNWKANGTGVANTDGSISSTVSANTTSGFSIVSYTGNGGSTPKTVGHGLGVAPKMIIIKPRNLAYDWMIYNENVGATKGMCLNTTQAPFTSSNFNDTAPTTSVFSVKNNATNETNGTYIAYCFAEKQGYSKFGSYTGNGSTDGTFVYTGFKPAWVMIKRSSSTGNWELFDNKRDIDNTVGHFLEANTSGVDSDLSASHTPLDFLSNGFKLRNSSLTGDTNINLSGSSYIYMAFAEQPLVGDNPATAR